MARSTKTFKKVNSADSQNYGVAIGFAMTLQGLSKSKVVELIEQIEMAVHNATGNLPIGAVVQGVYSDSKFVPINDPTVEPSNELVPRTMFDGATAVDDTNNLRSEPVINTQETPGYF